MSEPKDFAKFGEAVWRWVEKRGGNIFCHEDSEEIMEFAEAAGLAERVFYDPDKHGEIDAAPGDPIWFFKIQS